MKDCYGIISDGLQQLIVSAEKRKTDQGVYTYKNVLKKLSDGNEAEKRAGLAYLRRSLVKIELHGSFTSSEFDITRSLLKSIDEAGIPYDHP